MANSILKLPQFDFEQDKDTDTKLIEFRPIQEFRDFHYIGDWHKRVDMPECRGRMIQAAEVREGYFKGGLLHGKGRLIRQQYFADATWNSFSEISTEYVEQWRSGAVFSGILYN